MWQVAAQADYRSIRARRRPCAVGDGRRSTSRVRSRQPVAERVCGRLEPVGCAGPAQGGREEQCASRLHRRACIRRNRHMVEDGWQRLDRQAWLFNPVRASRQRRPTPRLGTMAGRDDPRLAPPDPERTQRSGATQRARSRQRHRRLHGLTVSGLADAQRSRRRGMPCLPSALQSLLCLARQTDSRRRHLGVRRG
jgi:hypothetical protein